MSRRWKRWLRRIPWIALAVGAILLGSGCGLGKSGHKSLLQPVSGQTDKPAAALGQAAGPSGGANGSPPQTPPGAPADAQAQGGGRANGRADKPPFTAPLTGLAADREIKERPVMVMVENAPQARPQTGLGEADIVYEILAEGEITRFAAVYQSHSPKVIGPVRSIRPYFVEIGDGFDALIVHAGWSQDAMNMIADRGLAHFDEVYGDGAYYWRSSDRKMPHNLYTSIEKIRQGAEKKKFRATWNGPVLHFLQPDETPGGVQALKVTIPYLQGYGVAYEYDAQTGLYKRFMEGKPHTDAETGQQLTAANVLICESKHRIVDDAGRRDVDVFGPGKGYMLQKGKMQPISWVRQGGIIRADANGKELPLVPGQTWVQVVPEGTKIAVQ